jgi:hypothetical protein
MSKQNTTVYSHRLTDEEKALADKKLKVLEKKLNLKLTFTNFVKYLINNTGVK